MSKAIYFDMDGTLAELYKVPNWLPMLRMEIAKPYEIAEPKVDMTELVDLLKEIRRNGYTIGVISWLSMGSTKEYDKAVRKAKREWLKANLPIDFDEIHLVKYGTPKSKVAKVKKSILVDDNGDVCAEWVSRGGIAVSAEPKEWVAELRKVVGR